MAVNDMIAARIRAYGFRHRAERHRVIGASPTDVVAPPRARPTGIRTHAYDADGHETGDGLVAARESRRLWIDVWGLADEEAVAGAARAAGLSPLAIADLFHVDQRPHTDVDGETVTITLRMPVGGPPFVANQITLALGPCVVLSVREQEDDCLGRVRARLAQGGGRIRGSSGYLFYAILDAVLETYFPLLERYGDALEDLEGRILAGPDDAAMRDLHAMRRDLLALRHAVWPLREAVASLQRDDVPGVDDALQPYLRDCADHAFQLVDMVEVYRETVQGLVDLHLSMLSNRMNDAMRVLAMIGAVFLPMSFVAGLYGMNFDRASPFNLPELGWRFGYPYALVLMVGSAGAMLWLFRRMGWIGRRGAPTDRETDE